MTWIGGVKRYCPVFSKFCVWSWRSSTRVVALPFVSASASRRRARSRGRARPRCICSTTRRPRRTATSRASSGSAPKALIASMRRRLPCRATSAAISSIGIADAARRLAMNGEDVRDARSALQDALDRGEIGRRVLGRLVDDGLAAGDVEDALGAMAVGAVDQDQDLAVGGTKVVSMASTAKVPEPCIGTVTKASSPWMISRQARRAPPC